MVQDLRMFACPGVKPQTVARSKPDVASGGRSHNFGMHSNVYNKLRAHGRQTDVTILSKLLLIFSVVLEMCVCVCVCVEA